MKDAEKKMTYFALYVDKWEAWELLTMEQRGVLITALFDYVQGGTPDISDPAIKMAFTLIRKGIDENAKRYAEIKRKNRENIKKRWAKLKQFEAGNNGAEDIRPNTTEYGRIRLHTKDKDKDKDKDNTTTDKSVGGGSVGKPTSPARARVEPSQATPTDPPTTGKERKNYNLQGFCEVWNAEREGVPGTRLPGITTDELAADPGKKEAVWRLMSAMDDARLFNNQHSLNADTEGGFIRHILADDYLNGRTQRRKTPANIFTAFKSEKIVQGIIRDYKDANYIPEFTTLQPK